MGLPQDSCPSFVVLGKGAPYLFLVIGKALNQVVEAHVMSGNSVGISLLPCSRNDQLISWDVDNTSFTIKGKRNHVENLVAFLRVFGMTLDLEIKPKKKHHISRSRKVKLIAQLLVEMGLGKKNPSCLVHLLV